MKKTYKILLNELSSVSVIEGLLALEAEVLAVASQEDTWGDYHAVVYVNADDSTIQKIEDANKRSIKSVTKLFT